MSSITKSIQKEYVLLMENAFSEKYKSAFRTERISEHKAHKNEIQILEKTPVSVLYGAYKKK